MSRFIVWCSMRISGGTRDGSQPLLLLSNESHAKKQKVVTPVPATTREEH